MGLCAACNPYRPSLFDTSSEPLLPQTCFDGELDGLETDTDCGGECDPCDDGDGCREPTDCTSGVCDGGTCQVPACDDEVENGLETDRDCGGDCTPCADDEGCLVRADCTSQVCRGDVCAAPTCADERHNGAESDVDCGGPIGDEACSRCAQGVGCVLDRDCAEGLICSPSSATCVAGACGNGVIDPPETDVDCGGGDCAPCRAGDTCALTSDCGDGTTCLALVCTETTCFDGLLGVGETDVDCGGATCEPCLVGAGCLDVSDCVTEQCRGDVGTCAGPAVLYRNLNTPATVKADVAIANDGDTAIELARVTLRYYLTLDPGAATASPLFGCYFFSDCATVTSSVTTLAVAERTPTADAFVEIGFTEGVLPANGQTATLQFEIRRDAVGTPFDPTNDFSVDPAATTALVPTARIVLYVDGVRLAGAGPE